MKVVAKILTYQLHLEEHPRFIMFSVLRMHPLSQTQSCHEAQVPKSHTADQYADA